MNQGTRRPRNVFRLPEPVNVNDPTWQGRTWQLVIDALNHIDECLDKYKDQVQENQIESSAWMAASKAGDADIEGRLLTHLNEHHMLDETRNAKRAVWIFQFEFLKEAVKVLSGIGIASIAWGIYQLLGG